MLDPQELKLECLKLAVSKSDTVEDVVRGANLLLEYVQGSSQTQLCNTGDKG